MLPLILARTRILCKFVLLPILWSYGISSQASEIFEYNRSLRSLGMGGAYISVVESQDAPLVNPAALAFVSEINWEMINLGGGINGLDIYNTVSNFKAITSAADYSQYFGKRIWVNAFGRTSVVMPGFGMAGFEDFKTSFAMHNPAYPQFSMDFINDYGLNIAGATTIGDRSGFGLAVKRINRWGGTEEIGLGVISSGNGSQIMEQFKNKGVGYGVDAAFMTKLPVSSDTRLAIVWQDVGDTRFSKTEGPSAPPAIENNLQIGLGTAVDWPGIDFAAAMEVRHVMNSSYSFAQKVHLGGEVSLPLLKLRGGLSQGYPTYGVGFSFLFFDFDLAYYFTELGAYPGQTPENRIQLGMSMGLSLDADFKFYSKDGKKRKLKQRR